MQISYGNVSASRVIPSMSVLNDIRENKRMQGKLPERLVQRWARIIATYKSRSEFPSFEVFFLSALWQQKQKLPVIPAFLHRQRRPTKTAKQHSKNDSRLLLQVVKSTPRLINQANNRRSILQNLQVKQNNLRNDGRVFYAMVNID